MSVYQAGTRVVITFGLKHGCKGTILAERETNGVAVIEVQLDGESESRLFRPSVLMRDGANP